VCLRRLSSTFLSKNWTEPRLPNENPGPRTCAEPGPRVRPSGREEANPLRGRLTQPADPAPESSRLRGGRGTSGAKTDGTVSWSGEPAWPAPIGVQLSEAELPSAGYLGRIVGRASRREEPGRFAGPTGGAPEPWQARFSRRQPRVAPPQAAEGLSLITVAKAAGSRAVRRHTLLQSRTRALS
jgi:hypothetical protein